MRPPKFFPQKYVLGEN